MKSVIKTLESTALAALLVAMVGCPPPDENEDAGGDGDAGVQHDAATGNDSGGGNDGGGGNCTVASWDITSDLTLVRSCSPYTIPGDINVNNNATLTIEAGVELRFSADSYLRIGANSPGKLVANGTTSQPIRFTSSQTTPAKGAWGGIQFETQTSSQTVLNYVHVRYGGQPVNSLFKGCVTVATTNPDRVTITNSTFEDCQVAGVTATEPGTKFAAFSANTFKNCDYGMWLNANVIGGVTGGQTYDGVTKNKLEGDTVSVTATWAKQDVVWEVTDDVDIQGTGNPVPTIPEGSTFKFPGDTWLSVGYSNPGRLVVAGSASAPVVFDTSETTPAAGSWVGIVFGTDTMASSTLNYVTVKHAGQPYNSLTRGCITVLSTDPGRIAITNTTVDTCAQSGFNAVDDGTTFATFNNNTVKAAPIGLNFNAQTIGSIGNALTFVSTTVNHIRGATVKATATWLKQSLPWNVDQSIYVDDAANPILTIAAGSVFRFSRDEFLEVGGNVGGGLIVAGTSGDPVLFTSRESSPTRGSWIGLVYGESTLATSSLAYTTIRYAGQNYNSILKGCLTVQSRLTGRIAVNNSTFDTCLQAAVAVINDGFGFVSFANNHFIDSALGLRLNAQAVGSIAASNTYDVSTTANHIIGDTVISSATWLTQPRPWIIEGSIYVEHESNNPVLTIQGPNTFRFAQNEELHVGASSAGGLIVSGTTGNEVVFESSQPTPVAGSWIGLYFSGLTLAGSTVDRAIIRHAGQWENSITLGAINVFDTSVTISNTTFNTILQHDVYVFCDGTVTDGGGNTFVLGGIVYQSC